jgi:hypothetical protein
MQDDPFARAVQRAEASEEARKASKRDRQRESWSSASRTAFRTHASVFVAVNLLLIVIWATTTPGYPWFLWPLLGWGIGLVAHFAAVKDSLRPPRGAAAPRHADQPYPLPAPTPAPAPALLRPVQPATAATPSTSDELQRLADLHAAGALDDDEFSAAKAKLLR